MKSQHHNDKKIVYSLLALSLFAGTIGAHLENRHLAISKYGSVQQATVFEAIQEMSQINPLKKTSLGFIGEISLDSKNKKDYSNNIAKANFLKNPDITFANLNQSNLDSKNISNIKQSGIDVVSLANETSRKTAPDVLSKNISLLNNQGILTCGAGLSEESTQNTVIVVQNNIKVGFLCFSDRNFTEANSTSTGVKILEITNQNFDKIIQLASSKVDSLIVSFDWGNINNSTHNSYQEALSKRATDDGAALIIGSSQKNYGDIGSYNNTPIVYSLGKFQTGAFFKTELLGRTPSSIKISPIKFDSSGTPNISDN